MIADRPSLTSTDFVALLRRPLADRQARKVQLYERELWKVGRVAQTGDAAALATFLALLERYERLVSA